MCGNVAYQLPYCRYAFLTVEGSFCWECVCMMGDMKAHNNFQTRCYSIAVYELSAFSGCFGQEWSPMSYNEDISFFHRENTSLVVLVSKNLNIYFGLLSRVDTGLWCTHNGQQKITQYVALHHVFWSYSHLHFSRFPVEHRNVAGKMFTCDVPCRNVWWWLVSRSTIIIW